MRLGRSGNGEQYRPQLNGRFFPDLQDERKQQRPSAMLGYKKMFSRAKEAMSGLGISGRETMLVYQWNNL